MIRFVLKGSLILAAIVFPLSIYLSLSNPPAAIAPTRQEDAGPPGHVVHPAPIEVRVRDLELQISRIKAQLDRTEEDEER